MAPPPPDPAFLPHCSTRRFYLVVVHQLADSDLVLVVFHVKLNVLVHFPLLVREGRHSLPDPGNQDLPARIDESV